MIVSELELWETGSCWSNGGLEEGRTGGGEEEGRERVTMGGRVNASTGLWDGEAMG